MSLDKAIQHNKEHRKPYHGSKAIDSTCRNHGGCPYCQRNRTHKNKVRESVATEKIKEFFSETY